MKNVHFKIFLIVDHNDWPIVGTAHNDYEYGVTVVMGHCTYGLCHLWATR